MSSAEATLWTTPDRDRFFLVPEDLELTAGPFLIRTPTERRASVDEAGLRVFEVSEEDAKAWAKAQLGGMLDDVRGAIDRFTDTLHRKAREL
jgi:hypothetical protein